MPLRTRLFPSEIKALRAVRCGPTNGGWRGAFHLAFQGAERYLRSGEHGWPLLEGLNAQDVKQGAGLCGIQGVCTGREKRWW